MNGPEASELVVDDTTIYEIDLECQECRKMEMQDLTPPTETIHWDFPPPDCIRLKQ